MRPSMTMRKVAAMSLLLLGTIAANDVAPSNTELEAMYDRAFRAFDAANYDQALKELDAIDARKPDLAASQNLRGVIYMRQGLFDKAEAALSESLRLDQKFWNARFNLAEIPFLKKDWPQARKRFQELLSNNAADLQGEATQLIQYKILLTYLLEGNDAMVDSILAKFEVSPDTPAVHYANAAIALQKQNSPEARKWMMTAEKNFSAQLNKLFAESLFEVGWLKQQPGQQRTALQLLSPEERASGTKAAAQSALEQAQQAYEHRDFDRALKLVTQADTAQPDQAPVLNLRGEILLEQGKFKEAEEYFRKAVKVDGKFREAQFNLADVPFRQKDYATARERFQALLKQTPGGDKNQAAQLINFKIFMTYLLEGKDNRAQNMMEQFQFSGDTPALYYAQAAWAFKHDKADAANDWIASARKIYPLASNAAYDSGFYDLGWLKSGASAASPAPSVAVEAAAVASAQNESPAPAAIEPSPIPGAEAKSEENTFVAAQTQPAPVAGMEATTAASPAAPKASEASVNPSAVAAATVAAGSPARPEDVPAAQSAAISPVVEMPSASAAATASLQPSQAPVAAQASASPAQSVPENAAAATQASAVPAPSSSPAAVAQTSPATALAPAKVPTLAQPTLGERLDQLTDPRTLISFAFLIAGLGIIAWVGIAEIRRRIRATYVGREPAVAGPRLRSTDEEGNGALVQASKRFTGGPRQVSVQLKASEPSSMRRASVAPAAAEAEPAQKREPEIETGKMPASDFDIEESFVGPVIEQASSLSAAEPSVAEATSAETDLQTNLPGETSAPEFKYEPAEAMTPDEQETSELAESAAPETEEVPPSFAVEETENLPANLETAGENNGEEEAVLGALGASDEVVEAPEAEESATVEEEIDVPEPFVSAVEPASDIESVAEPARVIASVVPESPAVMPPEIPSDVIDEPAPLPEPVAQGQPVPYQTVVETAEELPPEPPQPAEEAELRRVSGAIAGLGALRGAMPSSEEEFPSQQTTIQAMPETQTAPVIRTPAGSTQPSPAPSAPHATAAGVHTAVHITLSCEIASMQLTPTFKMGALQLRPISKVVTMRLAGSQQQQNGMNFQVNFEIAKVQPAPGSLGQIRLSPSQQQKPATLNSPSFNISGLQVVSGFEAAPLQLTPSQQGQASVHLTAAFQITTVEFSPTFEIAAMILNSSSKTVSVQLPAVAGGPGDSGPLFEVANVQLTANGDIGMLQLNPAATRRS